MKMSLCDKCSLTAHTLNLLAVQINRILPFCAKPGTQKIIKLWLFAHYGVRHGQK